MSILYEEIKWDCPKCKIKNTNTLLEIESAPVCCCQCDYRGDVFISAKLEIKEVRSSDNTVPYKEIEHINTEIDKSIETNFLRGVPFVINLKDISTD